MLFKALFRLKLNTVVSRPIFLKGYCTEPQLSKHTHLKGKLKNLTKTTGIHLSTITGLTKTAGNVIFKAVPWMYGCYKFFQEEFPVIIEKIRTSSETKQRKRLIGADVAHGFAWSHYSGYLQYVLKDIDKHIEASDWYKDLKKSKEWKNKEIPIPKKLYQVIPRQCFVNIPDKMTRVAWIEYKAVDRNGNNRDLKLPVYEIKDDNKIYFCICECPAVLHTIKEIKDLIKAGTLSEDSLKDGFTELIQLMRFYYDLMLILSRNSLSKNARLLTFNEETMDLPGTLLMAIKEDLKEKQPLEPSSQMDGLLYTSEKPDSKYEKQVYVTSTDDKENTDVGICIEVLEREGISILTQEASAGFSWQEKLSSAAGKCRFIIFIQPKENVNKERLVTSTTSKLLKKTIEGQKVQSIVVLRNKENCKLWIPKSLRWVSCVAYDDNKEYCSVLANVIKGSGEMEHDKSYATYVNLDDLIIGWSWGFANNFLNKILPDAVENLDVENKLVHQSKLKQLYLIFPLDGKTFATLGDRMFPEARLSNSPFKDKDGRTYKLTVYKLENPVRYFAGLYPSPVSYLRDLQEDINISEKQITAGAKELHRAIELIMKNCYREKYKHCNFVEITDNSKLKEKMDKLVKV